MAEDGAKRPPVVPPLQLGGPRKSVAYEVASRKSSAYDGASRKSSAYDGSSRKSSAYAGKSRKSIAYEATSYDPPKGHLRKQKQNLEGSPAYQPASSPSESEEEHSSEEEEQVSTARFMLDEQSSSTLNRDRDMLISPRKSKLEKKTEQLEELQEENERLLEELEESKEARQKGIREANKRHTLEEKKWQEEVKRLQGELERRSITQIDSQPAKSVFDVYKNKPFASRKSQMTDSSVSQTTDITPFAAAAAAAATAGAAMQMQQLVSPRDANREIQQEKQRHHEKEIQLENEIKRLKAENESLLARNEELEEEKKAWQQTGKRFEHRHRSSVLDIQDFRGLCLKKDLENARHGSISQASEYTSEGAGRNLDAMLLRFDSRLSHTFSVAAERSPTLKPTSSPDEGHALSRHGSRLSVLSLGAASTKSPHARISSPPYQINVPPSLPPTQGGLLGISEKSAPAPPEPSLRELAVSFVSGHSTSTQKHMLMASQASAIRPQTREMGCQTEDLSESGSESRRGSSGSASNCPRRGSNKSDANSNQSNSTPRRRRSSVLEAVKDSFAPCLGWTKSSQGKDGEAVDYSYRPSADDITPPLSSERRHRGSDALESGEAGNEKHTAQGDQLSSALCVETESTQISSGEPSRGLADLMSQVASPVSSETSQQLLSTDNQSPSSVNTSPHARSLLRGPLTHGYAHGTAESPRLHTVAEDQEAEEEAEERERNLDEAKKEEPSAPSEGKAKVRFSLTALLMSLLLGVFLSSAVPPSRFFSPDSPDSALSQKTQPEDCSCPPFPEELLQTEKQKTAACEKSKGTLLEELQRVSHAGEESQVTIRRLETQILDISAQTGTSEDKMKLLVSEKAELQKEAESLQGQLREYSEKEAKLQGKAVELEKKHTEESLSLRKELEKVMESFRAAEKGRETAEAALAEAKTNIETVEASLAGAESNKEVEAALVSAKEAAEEELLRLKGEAEASAEREGGLQAQVAALEKKHEEEITSLRKELERVKAALEASEQGRESAQAEAVDASLKLQKMEEASSLSQVDAKELQEMLQKLGFEKAELQKQAERLQEQVREYSEKEAKLQGKAVELEKKHAEESLSLRKELEKVMESLKAAEGKREETEKELSGAKLSIQKMGAASSLLKEDAEKNLQEAQARLLAENTDLQATVKRLQSDANAHAAREEELRKEMEELKQTHSEETKGLTEELLSVTLRLSAAEESRLEKEARLGEAERALQEIEKKVTEAHTAAGKLKEASEVALSEKGDLQKAADRLREQLTEYSQREGVLQRKVAALEKKHGEESLSLRKELEKVKESVKQAEKGRQEAEMALSQVRNEIEKKEAESAMLQTNVDVATKNSKSLTEALEESRSREKILQSTVEVAAKNSKSQAKALDEAAQREKALAGALEGTVKKIEGLARALEESSRREEALQTTVDIAAKNSKSQAKALEESKAREKALQVTVDAAAKNSKSQARALEKAATREKALAGGLEETTGRVEGLARALEETTGRAEVLDSERASLRTERDLLRDSVRSLEEDRVRARNQIDSLLEAQERALSEDAERSSGETEETESKKEVEAVRTSLPVLSQEQGATRIRQPNLIPSSLAFTVGSMSTWLFVGSAWSSVAAFGVAGTGAAISSLKGAALTSAVFSAVGGLPGIATIALAPSALVLLHALWSSDSSSSSESSLNARRLSRPVGGEGGDGE
uniref:Uncharacterized protein n=1 Tax=Chromera velia CCMP2878 TaxID=1169474 RepID=A0A0G4FFQ8_9ALVE|eukprot:Cvel_16747.t1-p1 / transcript=Cvel_16747.t1 / gene=Cvel_16747 / organism=Chromera_velia_CCMP2878 / gene_product=Flagellar attachment zone protein 1, putative / transcript_product=Flagellar attachment zone protein 1, putative / location=Cvel_scaffold1304:28402-35409(+) / protein_length=1707 / sequence_SO=supercontig / SO=protein_coding / is_pseudo=false